MHKKMLAVVVADVEVEGDFQFDRPKVGTSPADLRVLADWFVEREVEEVVVESTAQYWRPVWLALFGASKRANRSRRSSLNSHSYRLREALTLLASGLVGALWCVQRANRSAPFKSKFALLSSSRSANPGRLAEPIYGGLDVLSGWTRWLPTLRER